MRRLLPLLIALTLQISVPASRYDYNELDRLIAQRTQITEAKERHIDSIRQQLADPHLQPEQRLDICKKLYSEYECFRFDSAAVYADRVLHYARQLNDSRKVQEALLQKAHIHSLAGFFFLSKHILDDIRPETLDSNLRLRYYHECYVFSELLSEYCRGTSLHDEYVKKAQRYLELMLALAPKDSFLYIINKATELCRFHRQRQAIALLQSHLGRINRNGHEYAMYTNIIAECFGQLGDSENQRHYLVESAMADFRGVIKENTSLRQLATLLFNEGDVERAYKYLSVAVGDANFFGTRIRNMQDTHLIPQIQRVHSEHLQKERTQILALLLVISIVAVLLIVTIARNRLLIRRYRTANTRVEDVNRLLNDAVRNLKHANLHMSEGNRLKDEYIGRFLDLSSTIIDHADARNKLHNRLAREKKMAELVRDLKSAEYLQELTRMFYLNFDAAFLNIYPDFVDKVNALLLPDQPLEQKKKEHLTTELRVLALIRLGINDNAKIASILRSRLTTIYTYRSKLKARAKDRDNFEQQVARIGTLEAER